ncbi:pilus assembly protein [Psychromonas sp. KJ10-10]|uniref:pilus assembly protein n=1 Tax=Psychromonas sp. KJ10-10 TaxID=3391823 RepID=UPI0039B46476
MADSDNYCTGNNSKYWSGNYLNWATMARIDTVRKLLYGGYRSTDTDSNTVLERTYLPNDAHSFAKFYDGDDLTKLTPFKNNEVSSGITICNTTVNNNNKYSHQVNDAPLIRVAKGNYSLWVANERWQCRWYDEKGNNYDNDNDSSLSDIEANPDSPEKATNKQGLGEVDYVARVEACVSEALIGSENCKKYPDGNYKPIGLVQKYGDDGIVNFGLMTGSYAKNKSGGVLRKNVGPTSDEINTTTDGTLKTTPTAGSIIGTLNSFRLYGYSHNDGRYTSGDSCPWALSSFSNGNCSNWGNPVAEILSECYRYYAGKSANTAFSADDSGRFSNLKTATWLDPLNTVNECAKLNVIMLNASSISYDADELTKFDSDFNADSEALTKTIGDSEGITGNEFFVGENGTANNQLCTAKTVNNLGQVEGTCPDAPRLDGSYKIAGVAHFAHSNDIRASGTTALAGEQVVTTYGVALSPSVPSITIPVPGSDTKTVSILPACRNKTLSPNANCAIVDFKIAKAYQEDGSTGEYIGTLYVNWEDSEQGGDYDQDMWGTIKYRISSNEVTIFTDVIAQSTGNKMGFGYVISGTTQDGFHVHSGINNFTDSDADPSITDCSSKCTTGNATTSYTYTIGSSTASLLETPLFYAAKWGGFTDLDGDKKPSSSAEWDQKNNTTGDTGSDGIPDNYFLATNPSQLESQLKQVLDSIIASTASGSAAVVSNSTSGVGAVYQALYQPQKTEGNDTVEWIGSLNGIFIDDNSNLREDSDGDGVLDGYDVDKKIIISYNESQNDTFFQRYTTSDGGENFTATGSLEALSDLKSIWSAVDQLASFTNTGVRNQRSYTSSVANGRYIFTAFNNSSNDFVNNNDKVDFTTSAMTSANGDRYLAVDSTETADLVNYIRGDDSISNSRNRTISGTTWRLGDIIHSSPVMVSSPDAGYDISHSDTSYGEFLAQYSDRRQVVYVGANDGMLHAFNAGFWEEANSKFSTTNGSLTAHPLGSELWAYAPSNLLPHLQWLKEVDYPHVYYMDGVGFAQDVKIFEDDTTHKNGWGTILVMGMRYGGGAMDLDTNGDGTADKSTGSGYVIMDITDPESPPVLLAEITAPEIGYTTSKPAIVKNINGSNNDWFLVFGSGPHGSGTLFTGHSDQNARIIQVNLNTVASNSKNNATASIYKSGFSPTDSLSTETNSLVGDITVTDWDSDLNDDVVYFGTSSLDGTDVGGKLMRLSLSSGSVNTLVDAQRPIMSEPLTGVDSTINSNRWVMSGTGRYVTKADLSDTRQQWFFGVKEPKETDNTYDYDDAVAFSNLADTTDVRVYSDGSLENVDGSDYSLGGDTISNFEEMKNGTYTTPTAGMIGQPGWKVKFETPAGDPSGRSTGPGIADPVNTGVFVFFEYVPPSEICEVNGESYIWALSFETGTSTYYAPIGQDTSLTKTVGTETEIASLNKIPASGISDPDSDSENNSTGLVNGATFHVGTDGVKLIIGDSTGSISTLEINTETISGGQGRQSWRQIDTSSF